MIIGIEYRRDAVEEFRNGINRITIDLEHVDVYKSKNRIPKYQ